LYVNLGDGTFVNRTAEAGIHDTAWSSSASFLDYDRDGDLDLYVCHYLVDDPSRICRPGLGESRDYCGPSRYQGVADTLYRNEGDGRFVDISAAAGIEQAWPGFGVVCVDLTGDGWVDIYVANDKRPNQLYVNRRNGTFVEEGMERGVALNGAGDAEASMGVATGDVNSDGFLDLFVTNLVDETNTLYLSSKDGSVFFDRSASSGLGGPSLKFTGWGCGILDLDHDGDLDVLTVNGRVARGPVHPEADVGSFWNDYAEPNQVFLGDAAGRFMDARHLGGAFTSRVESSRALAFGDLDRDGDIDLVTSDVGNFLRIFLNDAPPPEHHWLGVRALVGERDALGALVTIEAAGRRQIRPIVSAYSFAAASEPVARFGLGTATTVDHLEVLWPDGRLERFAPSSVDRLVTLRQGEGKR
ncbi:MAG: CRTAC1 family protein, partial [Actinobacteria bacterium]|nr:CRTAC1 family protein [Actinomycetota bacterium]